MFQNSVRAIRSYPKQIPDIKIDYFFRVHEYIKTSVYLYFFQFGLKDQIVEEIVIFYKMFFLAGDKI